MIPRIFLFVLLVAAGLYHFSQGNDVCGFACCLAAGILLSNMIGLRKRAEAKAKHRPNRTTEALMEVHRICAEHEAFIRAKKKADLRDKLHCLDPEDPLLP